MPESVNLVKAELQELDANSKNAINPDRNVKVQFNPESLKVAFTNQIEQKGSGDQRGTPAKQFVGTSTTKLSLQLWFDVTAQLSDESLKENGKPVKDVRKLTQKVAYFITPKKEGGKDVPPLVRFIWGSFQFDGLIESLEESLEFFSPEGYPLRASVTINMSRQEIVFDFSKGENKPVTPGTKPMLAAPQGSNIQQIAANQGKQDDWQSLAAANGVENPRQLQPGQLLDMNALTSKVASLRNDVPEPEVAADTNAPTGGNSIPTAMRGRRGVF